MSTTISLTHHHTIHNIITDIIIISNILKTYYKLNLWKYLKCLDQNVHILPFKSNFNSSCLLVICNQIFTINYIIYCSYRTPEYRASYRNKQMFVHSWENVVLNLVGNKTTQQERDKQSSNTLKTEINNSTYWAKVLRY